MEASTETGSPTGKVTRDIIDKTRTAGIIGYAQAGASGFFDDAGYPTGAGWDEVLFPSIGDPNAFALEIQGDSMEPVYRDGDIIVVLPRSASGFLHPSLPQGREKPGRYRALRELRQPGLWVGSYMVLRWLMLYPCSPWILQRWMFRQLRLLLWELLQRHPVSFSVMMQY